MELNQVKMYVSSKLCYSSGNITTCCSPVLCGKVNQSEFENLQMALIQIKEMFGFSDIDLNVNLIRPTYTFIKI